MPEPRIPVPIDTRSTYPVYVPEPDVWWGKDGIDGWLGVEPKPYSQTLPQWSMNGENQS